MKSAFAFASVFYFGSAIRMEVAEEAAAPAAPVNPNQGRWDLQNSLAAMARDLEDCYPEDGGLKNSWWRPTTVVKPGRAWATPGQGPVWNKGSCGKVRGGDLLTYQWRTNQATRPAAYPYARTLLETRQPTQWRSGPYTRPQRRHGYGYQPKQACDYGCKQATY